MERNREVRRGSMAAMNGGLSRRRQQRSTNLRDSPEEDGTMELRDRDRKKDRDRDRSDRSAGSSRSKRRRGERLVHGSNRDEADDSSDESLDEEEEDDVEEDASASGVRLAAAVPNPLASSSTQQQQNQNQNQNRKSFPSKPARPPAWKMEEMIGVPVPRKARSSSLKRSQECGGGGGGGSGSGELLHRQSSTSPARAIPSPSTAISPSPSSSNASVRKKKPISGSKQRPPKISKSSSIQDIEIEVAEVLFGMTRHASNEAKSTVSSPGSFSPPPPAASSQPSVLPSTNLVAIAPKRKRPRLKLDEESQTSPAAKPEMDRTELLPKPEEGLASASPSRSEKKTTPAVSPAAENGSTAAVDHPQESTENVIAAPEQNGVKEEIAKSNLNADLDEPTVTKDVVVTTKADSPSEEKFSIDLMAPPPAPLENSERDGLSEPVKEMAQKLDTANGEMEKPDRKDAMEDILAKEKPVLDLQLDLKKQDKDGLSLGCGKRNEHLPKQQSEAPRIDPKQEKKAHSASLPLTMPIAAGWPGGFPHFGYMGQVPSLPVVMPMDGTSATAKAMQPPHFFPPQKPKRCATHCYIAQTIHYTQQIARMNPFWPPAAAAAAAAGTTIYGAKQHNLNVMPPLEAAILGNPLQGGFPGKSLGPLQDKASPAGPPAKERSSAAPAANGTLIEAQRKQYMLQQTTQPGTSAAPPNMLHGSAAFIFPIAPQPPPPPPAATQSVAAKSTTGIGNATAPASSAAAVSGTPGHSANTMSFNYAVMQPNDAQYLAVLQNNGYPFPIPAHVGGGPAQFRGVNPSQAMPFFNGSFYSSPMLHPPYQPQLLQQQQQPPPTHQQPPAHSQQGHQNTSTSSGSSSSQKHQPQPSQRVPGGGAAAAAAATPAGGNSHNLQAKQHLHLLPPPQARQLESEAGCEDSPSTTDSSRAPQAQKSIYGNFAMSFHPQNFTLISPAAASLHSTGGGGGGGGGSSHTEKQQTLQNQGNLTPSQAYAMSLAAFGGPATAAGGAPGLDFSSMVQNHALFHSLPEAARHHGYQQMTAGAVSQAVQHKKSHHEDGKSGGDQGATGANASRAEGKMIASPSKAPSGVGQHSLSFGRPDNEAQISTILGNSSNITEGSSQTLNLIQPPANGARTSTQPSTTTPASSSAAATAVNPALSSLHMQPSQQQQHLIQLHKSQQQQQPQQMLQLQQQMSLQRQQQQFQLQQQMPSRPKSSSHSNNNATIYSDRMSAGSPASRFPQGGVASFPPSIIQGASTAQSPQWKAPGRAATPGPANSATSSSSSAKNQLQQQQQQQQHQGRNPQQHQQSLLSPNAHQTHISFGVSSSKAVGVSGQNSSLTSAAAAGTPQNSVSKSSAGGGGNGSPRVSSSSKSGPSPTSLLSPALPLQQQTPAAKNSPLLSPSNLKSPPSNNRNMTYSQLTPAPNSSSSTAKFQQQSQQQQQKQSFHQPQLFFANPYIQAAQSSQSNSNAATVAANFYQQRQQSQHHSQQLQQQNSTNSGVLSLCPSSLTLAASSAASDPAKAAAAATGGMKGLTPAQHMSASFPYMHTTSSSVSLKPAGDQKAAPGSDNLHWKPEKR